MRLYTLAAMCYSCSGNSRNRHSQAYHQTPVEQCKNKFPHCPQHQCITTIYSPDMETETDCNRINRNPSTKKSRTSFVNYMYIRLQKKKMLTASQQRLPHPQSPPVEGIRNRILLLMNTSRHRKLPCWGWRNPQTE